MNGSLPAYGLWPLVVIDAAGFITIMLGFLLQWPTLPTLVLFPILVTMYVRLARREEAEARNESGAAYASYAAATPAFVPRLRNRQVGQV